MEAPGLARFQLQEYRRQLVRAVLASAIGSAIEWYDFFLYQAAAVFVFPKLFFPKSDPLTGTLLSFATFGVGFAARPLGAAIFGHFGDRVGRKATLIATLLVMGVATALIGCLPTYSDAGITAAVLLTSLRFLQGLGVGGEWGGAVLLSVECGPNGRRGFIGSWSHAGVPMGLLLANGVLLITRAAAGADFMTWAWRIPFLLSLVMIGIGFVIRMGVLETPVFARLREERRIEPAPVRTVLRRHPREILLCALVRLPEQAPFYIFTFFLLNYGSNRLGLSYDFLLLAVLMAAAVSLVTIPLAGHLSDRLGRKTVYMTGSFLIGLFAFPYFGLLNSGMSNLVMLAIVISLIPHGIQHGPQPALIAETFTARLRYSGASLGYHLASLVAGGPAPLIAQWLLVRYGGWLPPALYLISCSLVGLVALAFLPDRSHSDISVEYDGTQPEAESAPRIGSRVLS